MPLYLWELIGALWSECIRKASLGKIKLEMECIFGYEWDSMTENLKGIIVLNTKVITAWIFIITVVFLYAHFLILVCSFPVHPVIYCFICVPSLFLVIFLPLTLLDMTYLFSLHTLCMSLHLPLFVNHLMSQIHLLIEGMLFAFINFYLLQNCLFVEHRKWRKFAFPIFFRLRE